MLSRIGVILASPLVSQLHLFYTIQLSPYTLIKKKTISPLVHVTESLHYMYFMCSISLLAVTHILPEYINKCNKLCFVILLCNNLLHIPHHHSINQYSHHINAFMNIQSSFQRKITMKIWILMAAPRTQRNKSIQKYMCNFRCLLIHVVSPLFTAC